MEERECAFPGETRAESQYRKSAGALVEEILGRLLDGGQCICFLKFCHEMQGLVDSCGGSSVIEVRCQRLETGGRQSIAHLWHVRKGAEEPVGFMEDDDREVCILSGQVAGLCAFAHCLLR